MPQRNGARPAHPERDSEPVLSTRVAIVHNPGMNRQSSYRGYRFPPEIISHAVWLYHRFTLSFRDIEDLLAERGVIVTYESIRQWYMKSELFSPASQTPRAIGGHVVYG